MEKIGAAYAIHFMNEDEAESKSYLQINPVGKVPGLEDGALKMCESGAICSYLADKHGKFIPPPMTLERAKHDQWMFFAVAMVEPHTARLLVAEYFYKNDPEGPIMQALALEALEENLPALEEQLSKAPYLLGEDFMVADLMMTSCLRLASHTDLLEKYPAITGYINRNVERPAFLRAVEKQ